MRYRVLVLGSAERMSPEAARDPVFVENLRIDPDVAARRAHVEVMVRNAEGTACGGTITLYVYELTAALVADGSADRFCDRAQAVFGLRQVTRDGNRLRVNGRPLFLRGTNENAVFPRTAYAPMDVESWLGLYLQPELPYWGEVDERMWPFYREEARRILKAYGNHPSFVMLSGGNELKGDTTRMDELVEICRREDGRHLYAWGSNCFFSQALPPGCSDYWTTMNTDRGARRGHHAKQTRLHRNQQTLRRKRPWMTRIDSTANAP